MRMRDSPTLGTGKPFGGAGRGRFAPDLEFPFLPKLLSHLATRNPGSHSILLLLLVGMPAKKNKKNNNNPIIRNREKKNGWCVIVIKTASLEIIAQH